MLPHFELLVDVIVVMILQVTTPDDLLLAERILNIEES